MAGGLPAGGSGQGTEGRNLCRGCSSKDKASILSKMHPLIDHGLRVLQILCQKRGLNRLK